MNGYHNYFSTVQLDAIEELANTLTLPEDIALITEIDKRTFIDELKNDESDIYKAFYRGLANREQYVRNLTFGEDVSTVDDIRYSERQLIEFKTKLTIQLYK